MTRLARPLLPIVVLLACAVPGAIRAAEPGSLVLTGGVREAGGGPLAGVLVMVQDEPAGEQRKAVTTGSDGRFRVSGLAPGRYRVVAARTGYATRQVDHVRVETGREAPLELALTAQRREAAATSKPAAPGREVHVLAPAFADEVEVQAWLNERTAAGEELLAFLRSGDATLAVVRTSPATKAPLYTALLLAEPLQPERLEARLAQQKDKTFVGLVPLGPDRYALVFRNDR